MASAISIVGVQHGRPQKVNNYPRPFKTINKGYIVIAIFSESM